MDARLPDRQPKSSLHLALPNRGDAQYPTIEVSADPFSFQRDFEKSRAERTAEMRPPLAPVHACEREATAQRPRGLDVDTQRFERLRAVRCEVVGSVPRRRPRQPPQRLASIVEGNAESARDVIVASSCGAEAVGRVRYEPIARSSGEHAHQVRQQPGPAMPNAFLIPMSKTAAWWAKDWMERHTYFLPRYDEAGRMVSQGHALAAAAGIPRLMRRTYKNSTEPAPEGAYDFLTYFECADADIETFHEVCAALRDVTKNPEWRFVGEGPTWHGRRVRTWPELFE